MNTLLVIAQEGAQPPFGSLLSDWVVILTPILVFAFIGYAVFVRLPKSRQDAARMLKLLEEIRDQLVELNNRTGPYRDRTD